MLSLSLLVISLDNTILNVALPSIEGDLGRIRLAAPVDRGLLRARVRRAAAYRRQPSATASAAAGRWCSGSRVFGAGSALSALCRLDRRADRQPGPHGRRRRVHHADHALGPDQRVPRRGAGARRSGSGRRWPASAWPSARSPAAGCSSTSTGRPCSWSTSPSSRSASPGRCWLVPESRDPEQAKLDPVGAGLSIAGLTTLVWAIIEAPQRRLGQTRWSSRSLGAGVALLVAFARWELHTPSADARREAVPQRRVQRCQRSDRPGVLRPVRDDLLPHPVPPGSARLHRARGGRAHAARRRRAGARRAAVGDSSPSGSARAWWWPSA